MRFLDIHGGARHALSLRATVVLLLFFSVLFGCGKKGPVMPLKQPLPAAPERFAVAQKGDRFLLAWDIPRYNQQGTALTDLEGFKIYKMTYDPVRDCPECRDTSILLRQVSLEYLQEVHRSGDRLYLWDADLEPGFGYQYKVVPYNRSGRDGAPVQERRLFLSSPLPPQKFAATGHDRLVRLRWEAVVDERQGVEPLGYRVYRWQTGTPLFLKPITLEFLGETSYEDFDLKNGQTYFYAVSTVVRIQGNVVESALSQTVEAVPREGQ